MNVGGGPAPVQRSTARAQTTTRAAYKGRARTALFRPCASICLPGVLADLGQSWDRNGTPSPPASWEFIMVSSSLPGYEWLKQHFFLEMQICGFRTLIYSWVSSWKLPGIPVSLLYESVHRLARTERNIFTPGPAGSKHDGLSLNASFY